MPSFTIFLASANYSSESPCLHLRARRIARDGLLDSRQLFPNGIRNMCRKLKMGGRKSGFQSLLRAEILVIIVAVTIMHAG